MRHTSTHTYAILQISREAFEEIRQPQAAAGYQDQFHDDPDGLVIDMRGIAVQGKSAVAPESGDP